MADRWRKTILGDHVDLLTGFPFESKYYSEAPLDVRLLRGDNIAQGVLRWDGVKRWSAARLNDYNDYKLQVGDVVIAMDRPWIEVGLKYAAIMPSDIPALLVQRVARLRGTADLDTKYLRYLVGSKEFTQHILAVQTGTAVPHISAAQIKSFKFNLPPLHEQRAIAHILGTFDDKIDSNRRMNETLETMARVFFKSWFVDFDAVRTKAEGREPLGLDTDTATLFPSSFEDSALGKIPRGWKVQSLQDIADFLNGLALQKYPPQDGESLPVIKIAQLRRGDTEGADRASTNIPREYVVLDGDILFSWSGSLEVESWSGGPGALNQHLFKVTSHRYPKWFYFHWIREHLPDFQAIASGKATTMGHIQRHHLKEATVLVPEDGLLAKMDKVMSPLFEATANNNLQSRTIAAIRDSLLPRLISGEIQVENVNGAVKH